MPERCFVIRRGVYSGPRGKYWVGFKEQTAPRPRLQWSNDHSKAIRFARENDAQQVIVGLRMWKRISVKPMLLVSE